MPRTVKRDVPDHYTTLEGVKEALRQCQNALAVIQRARQQSQSHGRPCKSGEIEQARADAHLAKAAEWLACAERSVAALAVP
jgi:hypothetical protein